MARLRNTNGSRERGDDAGNASVELSQKRAKVDLGLMRRIYERPEYTAVVRVIGDLSWSITDARDLVVPLMKRFGAGKVLETVHELAVIEEGTARLSDEVRRYALPLLGQKCQPNGNTAGIGGVEASVASEKLIATESTRERLRRLKLDGGETTPATDYVLSDRSRDNMVKQFETYLNYHDLPFRRPTEREFGTEGKRPPIKIDFVVKRQSELQLTLVRKQLSATVRQRLVSYCGGLALIMWGCEFGRSVTARVGCGKKNGSCPMRA